MICPNTPKSVIAELLKKDDSPLRNKSWNTFFSIYYDIIRLMAKKSLIKIGWTSFTEEDVSDILSQTYISLENAFSKGLYNPTNGQYFRGFLKRIVSCRVVDFIRAQNKQRTISIESIDLIGAINREDDFSENYFQKLEEDEEKAFFRAKILDIWESIRHAYSNQIALIFEMRILENRPILEICEELNVDRAKIDSAVHRIKKRIKEELEQTDFRKDP